MDYQVNLFVRSKSNYFQLTGSNKFYATFSDDLISLTNVENPKNRNELFYGGFTYASININEHTIFLHLMYSEVGFSFHFSYRDWKSEAVKYLLSKINEYTPIENITNLKKALEAGDSSKINGNFDTSNPEIIFEHVKEIRSAKDFNKNKEKQLLVANEKAYLASIFKGLNDLYRSVSENNDTISYFENLNIKNEYNQILAQLNLRSFVDADRHRKENYYNECFKYLNRLFDSNLNDRFFSCMIAGLIYKNMKKSYEFDDKYLLFTFDCFRKTSRLILNSKNLNLLRNNLLYFKPFEKTFNNETKKAFVKAIVALEEHSVELDSSTKNQIMLIKAYQEIINFYKEEKDLFQIKEYSNRSIKTSENILFLKETKKLLSKEYNFYLIDLFEIYFNVASISKDKYEIFNLYKKAITFYEEHLLKLKLSSLDRSNYLNSVKHIFKLSQELNLKNDEYLLEIVEMMFEQSIINFKKNKNEDNINYVIFAARNYLLLAIKNNKLTKKAFKFLNIYDKAIKYLEMFKDDISYIDIANFYYLQAKVYELLNPKKLSIYKERFINFVLENKEITEFYQDEINDFKNK